MKKLASVCIERPVFAAMLILCLIVVGTASYTRLGVDRFPAMDLPSVFIRTQLPGASPEEVEVLISQQIEEAVNTVQGLDELRSISGAGSSIVIATFQLDRDIEAATQDVRDRIATVLARLPRDVRPPIVGKADNDSSPVMTIALSANRPLRELTEIADKVVKPFLERSAGVGDLYLLTTTAASFFTRLGFQPADRATAPAAIRASREFAEACPATAAFMRRSLASAS